MQRLREAVAHLNRYSETKNELSNELSNEKADLRSKNEKLYKIFKEKDEEIEV